MNAYSPAHYFDRPVARTIDLPTLITEVCIRSYPAISHFILSIGLFCNSLTLFYKLPKIAFEFRQHRVYLIHFYDKALFIFIFHNLFIESLLSSFLNFGKIPTFPAAYHYQAQPPIPPHCRPQGSELPHFRRFAQSPWNPPSHSNSTLIIFRSCTSFDAMPHHGSSCRIADKSSPSYSRQGPSKIEDDVMNRSWRQKNGNILK